MNVDETTDWQKLWIQQRSHFKATIFDNEFIPQKPFSRQVKFLIYPNREILYGGMAGGGKSTCILMSALQYVEEKFIPAGEKSCVSQQSKNHWSSRSSQRFFL